VTRDLAQVDRRNFALQAQFDAVDGFPYVMNGKIKSDRRVVSRARRDDAKGKFPFGAHLDSQVDHSVTAHHDERIQMASGLDCRLV